MANVLHLFASKQAQRSIQALNLQIEIGLIAREAAQQGTIPEHHGNYTKASRNCGTRLRQRLLDLTKPAAVTQIGQIRPDGGSLSVDEMTTRTLSGAGEDRKSTRLNSSHLGISYAVFCLK